MSGLPILELLITLEDLGVQDMARRRDGTKIGLNICGCKRCRKNLKSIKRLIKENKPTLLQWLRKEEV